MTISDVNTKLLHLFEIPLGARKHFNALQGSDHHTLLKDADVFTSDLISQIRLYPNADILVLNGDLFDASEGEATQER